ncbi:MAG TPA: formate dehydrogenase subunit gamma [Planctomycetota bacterium]|nr:formate dehydrogenase subunit gamma [Planctomycetota bacterium]
MPSSESSGAPSSASVPPALAAVDAAIARLRELPGALLPILHAIQDELGYVPPAATARIANALNLSLADVHGVITFYHDFRSKPPGRHVLKLCRAEACQSMGCERLEEHLRERHGVSMKQTSADGSLTVEPVYCLGNCALSPALLFDGKLQGRVTEARLDELLAAAVAGGRA